METQEYFDEVEKQRLIVETEIRLAARKAHRDMLNNTADFLNPDIQTNPYIGESVAMENAYNDERKLLIAEFNRQHKGEG